MISEGRWSVGEKIPTEIELSEMFGVNRLTVRMALQRLIGMGLLETRIGDGTYVKQFSFRDYINNVSDFYLTSDMMDDILEYRNSIEIGTLRLAVDRAATDEEIEELCQICDQMDAAKAAYIKKQTEESLVLDRTDAWISNAAKEKPEDDKHRRVYLTLKERNLAKCMKEYSDIIDYHVLYF